MICKTPKEVVKYGIMSLFISPSTSFETLSAAFLEAITVQYILLIFLCPFNSEVASAFDIPLTETFQPQSGLEMTRGRIFISI